MTAEVLVMNKQGVALAADSAVTVGGRKVYNSANKIFRLSKKSSIGILVYANSEINGIPLEILIKSFRSSRKGPWPKLTDCAKSFLSYLRSNKIASLERENAYVDAMTMLIHHQILDKYRLRTGKKSIPIKDQIKNLTNAVTEVMAEMDLKNPCKSAKKCTESLVRLTHEARIRSIINEGFNQIQQEIAPPPISVVDSIVSLCIQGLYKINNYSSPSGIVITGYGDNEFFPSYAEYHVFGILCGELLYEKGRENQVGLQNNAVIVPFAQRDVIDTFITGINPNMQTGLNGTLALISQTIKTFVAGIPVANPGLKSILTPLLTNVLNQYHANITDALDKTMNGRIAYNTQEVIGALSNFSIPDLAQMAKNLVEMTSFKRMVSLDIATVGGPIDVAVISKGDGFIWIDRKHYFTKEKNEHFFDDYKDK